MLEQVGAIQGGLRQERGEVGGEVGTARDRVERVEDVGQDRVYCEGRGEDGDGAGDAF